MVVCRREVKCPALGFLQDVNNKTTGKLLKIAVRNELMPHMREFCKTKTNKTHLEKAEELKKALSFLRLN